MISVPSAGQASNVPPGFQLPPEEKAKAADADAELAEMARNKRLMETMVRQIPGAAAAGGKEPEPTPGKAAEKGVTAPRPVVETGMGSLGELIGISTASSNGAADPSMRKSSGDTDEEILARRRYAGSGAAQEQLARSDVEAFKESLSAFIDAGKVWAAGLLAIAALLYGAYMWTTRKARAERRRLYATDDAHLRAAPEAGEKERVRSSRRRRKSSRRPDADAPLHTGG